MPRPMPPLSARFQQRVVEALSLSRAGDFAALSPIGSKVKKEWHIPRVELLYELAFLRMFNEWEVFLEQALLRYLCGYTSVAANVQPLSGVFFSNIALANRAMLGTRHYVLWHDPQVVTQRTKIFLKDCPIEVVIGSHSTRLSDLAAIRHRIAHAQDDARKKFDLATINITGRRYRGARPGRFLRDWDRNFAPPRRWLETLGLEFQNLAKQIA